MKKFKSKELRKKNNLFKIEIRERPFLLNLKLNKMLWSLKNHATS